MRLVRRTLELTRDGQPRGSPPDNLGFEHPRSCPPKILQRHARAGVWLEESVDSANASRPLQLIWSHEPTPLSPEVHEGPQLAQPRHGGADVSHLAQALPQ